MYQKILYTIPTNLSLTFYYLGAAYKIVDIDNKRRADSEKVAFTFRISSSLADVPEDILKEIHKFLYPVQKLRILLWHQDSKGKEPLALTTVVSLSFLYPLPGSLSSYFP